MVEDVTVPFAPGELIAGKYRMDRVIGAGGMGLVLEATHLDLDRKVAVKLIRPELATDESLVERMLIEARAAAKIRSNHVGTVLDVGRLEDGAPYLVMEYLEGSDLSVVLEREHRLPITEAVDLILQACEALAHAHKAKIIHRDLKPENLFIITAPDGTRDLKVLDFGIAKQLEDPQRRVLTNPATAVGSPQYMAPEQMEASEVSARADVWALGAILYETLGGKRAFPGETVPEVCAHVLTRPPRPLREVAPFVPVALESIVNRCLQKDPLARFGSVGELGQALLPHGSARAQMTFRNVRAVLSTGDLQLDKTEAAPTGQITAPISEGVTDGAVSMNVHSVGSITEPMHAARSSGPPIYAIGAVVATLIGGGAIAAVWGAGDDDSATISAERTEASTSPVEAPGAPAVADTVTVVSEPLSDAGAQRSVARETATSPPPTDAPSAPPVVRLAPTEAPVTASPPAPPQRKATKPKKKAATSVPAPTPTVSTARPKRDAWDPDSFGSRH